MRPKLIRKGGFTPAESFGHGTFTLTVRWAIPISPRKRLKPHGLPATSPKWASSLRSQRNSSARAIPIYAGDRVLDVATASGNTAISAARRRAIVTGIDLAPSLLDYARRRAEIEGFNIDFREGNAMALAFPDASFHVIG